jgi:hypothetical protein
MKFKIYFTIRKMPSHLVRANIPACHSGYIWPIYTIDYLNLSEYLRFNDVSIRAHQHI